ncbi:MAG TPA: cupredoxin domain-containing protein [Roseiflexaceae bacterium]|nr:cupredoxin domain-containing protein [Roseiflexaceae bacterium]
MHHLLRPTISVLLAALLWSRLTGSAQLNAASTHPVNVADSLYQPETIVVQLGDTVAWNNTGAIPHTVSANDGSFESGNMNTGDAFAHTFNQPGTFEYYCKYHAVKGSGIGMIGRVIVEGAPPPPPPEPSPEPPPPSPEPPPPAPPEPSPQPQPAAPAQPSPEPPTEAPKPKATTAPVAVVASSTATPEPSATPEPTTPPTEMPTRAPTTTALPTAKATATVPPTEAPSATSELTAPVAPTTVASPAIQAQTESIASNSAGGNVLPIAGVVVLALAAVGLWRWRSRR